MAVFDLTKKIASLNNFMPIYKSTWEEIYDKGNVFRYKLLDTEEKLINNKYLVLYNPDRGHNRRAPQEFDSFHQPFDNNKFNFTKVSHEEVMFTFNEEQNDDRHAVIVNVSPISKYHSLLCPSIDKCLPQVPTKESIKLAIDIMIASSDRDLRIAFNTLRALASVNHLHYHLCIVKQNLPVETVECIQIRGPLYCLSLDYPAYYAFVFEVLPPNNPYEDIYKVLEYFITRSIPHNIFITRGKAFESEKEAIRVIIWPRKGSDTKNFQYFNVAALEFSGLITVYDKEVYDKVEESEIDRLLKIWKYEFFDGLCEQLKYLYKEV